MTMHTIILTRFRDVELSEVIDCLPDNPSQRQWDKHRGKEILLKTGMVDVSLAREYGLTCAGPFYLINLPDLSKPWVPCCGHIAEIGD